MSVAAHDLRNPIAVVRASAQMAQRQINRGDTEGAQGRLTAIVDQTDRLSDMLETFLDPARMGPGPTPTRHSAGSSASTAAAAQLRPGNPDRVWGCSPRVALRACTGARSGGSNAIRSNWSCRLLSKRGHADYVEVPPADAPDGR